MLASLDTAVSIALLTTVSAGQPAALTVVCAALVAGLLFPPAVLVLLVVPLVFGSLGAPATVLSAAPTSWQGWLALVAGMPALVLGVCVIGSVVQRNVQSMVEARQQAAEAVAAVGAARSGPDWLATCTTRWASPSMASRWARRRCVGWSTAIPTRPRSWPGPWPMRPTRRRQEARALLMSLREGQIDRPTVEVVNEVLADWQATTGISARLVDVAAVDASPAVTSQMVAALREILHNIDKHAQAKTVTVRLTGDPERIELVVADDGVGFDVERTGAREADGHFDCAGCRNGPSRSAARWRSGRRSERGPRFDGRHNGTGRPDHDRDEDIQGDDALPPKSAETVRVGIADDNAVVRMGIRSLLATADDIVVVGEAGDETAAVTLARTAKPDVMLLDVRMPRQDGVSAAPDVASTRQC